MYIFIEFGRQPIRISNRPLVNYLREEKARKELIKQYQTECRKDVGMKGENERLALYQQQTANGKYEMTDNSERIRSSKRETTFKTNRQRV